MLFGGPVYGEREVTLFFLSPFVFAEPNISVEKGKDVLSWTLPLLCLLMYVVAQ